jgi:hypothetical protein
MFPIFFDSHGSMWVACPAIHPDAKAFGPTGIARELRAYEVEILGLLDLENERTPWAVAHGQGRVQIVDGWDQLYSGSWS